MPNSVNAAGKSDPAVTAFIAALADDRKREEALVLDDMHRRVTGTLPRMWGPSMIGYGSYHYRYESGREGDFLRGGFSPRKAAHSIYLMGNYCEQREEADDLFARLGKYRTGKSCLYVTRLANVDLGVLERLVALSWRIMAEQYPD